MKRLVLAILKSYKKFISPLLLPYFGRACRFTPTCSEYTIEAVDKKGVLIGLVSGIKRFLRCNPFTKPGFDPVK